MQMEQMSLSDDRQVYDPLASRLRSESLGDFMGQKHLLGEGKVLCQLTGQNRISSVIFRGSPGVGKTALASIIAGRIHIRFINFSVVTSSIKEVKKVIAQTKESRRMGAKTVVLVDEIHRFDKAQQNAFLPYVEKESIILIGATTEDPPLEVDAALLSRCKVLILQAPEKEDLEGLIRWTIKSSKGFGFLNIDITDDTIGMITEFANGDVRTALNTLGIVVNNGEISTEKTTVMLELLKQCIGERTLLYDKKGEEHYSLISALHRSMRNSDLDAVVYCLTRMPEANRGPLYVARRLVWFVSKDIGMAGSQVLQLAVSAYQACHFLGMPECNVHLSHAVIYLSMVPKTNSAYMTHEPTKADTQNMLAGPVPLQIRNAPTSLIKELHYREDYIYVHDTEEKIAHVQCLPDFLEGKAYYHPSMQGAEAVVEGKLEVVKRWKTDGERKDWLVFTILLAATGKNYLASFRQNGMLVMEK